MVDFCVYMYVQYLGIMDVLYRLCDTEGSSDEMLEQRYTQGPRKQASRVTHIHF